MLEHFQTHAQRTGLSVLEVSKIFKREKAKLARKGYRPGARYFHMAMQALHQLPDKVVEPPAVPKSKKDKKDEEVLSE